jgi:pimeloyl-ACP methyl ester carboxylesterase
MTHMQIRDVSLFVKVMGQGYPLVLMHGGPSLDHTTLLPLEPLADQFTLVFYDHRCNGRSDGADVTSMTLENLTSDAEALRQALGFDQWAVLGHSFGGNVALEYALRFPQSLSHLILMNTGGDQRWVSQNAPKILAKRGYSADTVEAARRFYNGQVTVEEYFPTAVKFLGAYSYHRSLVYNPRFLAFTQKVGLGPHENATGSPNLGYRHCRLTVMDSLARSRCLPCPGGAVLLVSPEHQVILATAAECATRADECAGHNRR